MANKFVTRTGLVSLETSHITGSLFVSDVVSASVVSGTFSGVGNQILFSGETADERYLQNVSFDEFSASVDSSLDILFESASDHETRIDLLEAFSTSLDDTFVNQEELASATGTLETTINNLSTSLDARLDVIETTTASYNEKFAAVQTVTESYDSKWSTLQTTTESYNNNFTNIHSATASLDGRITSLEEFSNSLDDSFVTQAELASATGALETTITNLSTSLDDRLDVIETTTASYNEKFSTIQTVTESYDSKWVDAGIATSSLFATASDHETRIDSLEAFSTSLDDTFVNQTELANATGALETTISNLSTSLDARLDVIETTTSSYNEKWATLQTTTESYDNNFTNIHSATSSYNEKWSTLQTTTESYDINFTNIHSTTASLDGRITSLEEFSNSLDDTFVNQSELAAATGALETRLDGVDQTTAAFDGRLDNIELATQSYDGKWSTLQTTTESYDNNFTNIHNATSSYNGKFDTLGTLTASYDINFTNIHLATQSYNDKWTDAGIATSSLFSTASDHETRIDSLEAFSTSLDDTFVNQSELASATGAIETRLDGIDQTTAAFDGRLDSIELATQSYDGKWSTLQTTTESYNNNFTNIHLATQSYDGKFNTLETTTASYDVNFTNIHLATQSLFGTASDHETRIDSLEAFSTSLDDTFATEAEVSGYAHLISESILNNYGIISGSSQLDNTTVDGFTLTNVSATGSFTGSFIGDGSQLTGIVTSFVISGSDGNNDSIALKTEALIVSGVANETDVVIDSANNTLTIGLTDDVTITNRLSATAVGNTDGTTSFTGSFSGDFSGDGSGLTNVTIANATTYTASIENATTFTANHNLGTENVIVAVYDQDSYQIWPGSVQVTSENQVVLTFSVATTGYVVIAKAGHIVSGSYEWEFIINKPTVVSGSEQITISDTTGFTTFSESIDNHIDTKLDSASFDNWTSSVYLVDSASFDTRIDNLEAFSTSLDDTFVNQTELANATGSLINSIATKLDTGSYNTDSASFDTRIDALEAVSASEEAVIVVATAGGNIIKSVTKTGFDAMYFDYVIKNGSNLRAGTIIAVWDSLNNVQYFDNSTQDLGNTSEVGLQVIIDGTNVVLQTNSGDGTYSMPGYTIKARSRGL
jgi:predicted  nucleic acid-binding Zn-ribbon protein